MSQQVFAEFIGLAPATLSGIFNDRTRPTLNVVESIKKKIPNISTDWLMFGTEPMFLSDTSVPNETKAATQGGTTGFVAGGMSHEPMLDFGPAATPTPSGMAQPIYNHIGVRSTHLENVREEAKYFDKHQRRVTEIRVYYDDQTWESFVPSKK